MSGAHYFLKIPPWQSQTSILRSFHSSKLPFFLKKHHRGTLYPELSILTGLQEAYLSMTSYLHIFQEYNHLTAKHCLNINPTIGLDLESLLWEVGTLPIQYKCNESSKLLPKVIKITFRTL